MNWEVYIIFSWCLHWFYVCHIGEVQHEIQFVCSFHISYWYEIVMMRCSKCIDLCSPHWRNCISNITNCSYNCIGEHGLVTLTPHHTSETSEFFLFKRKRQDKSVSIINLNISRNSWNQRLCDTASLLLTVVKFSGQQVQCPASTNQGNCKQELTIQMEAISALHIRAK